MEEKERYELVEEDFAYAIVDNEEHKTYQQDCFDFGNICDLLNQQDKRIKELEKENEKLKQQIEENAKYKEWMLEFLEKNNIDINSTPEYSENPIIEYCEQIKDFRECEITELKQQLAEKDLAIENWQTMYESVVQTCHNDKEEIERLNKQLETQENTITNIVEDNRASQEWYKKQLEEKEKELAEHADINNTLNSGLQEKCILCEEEHNQDKISFAIAELEKVKETTECVLDNALRNSSLNQSYYDRLLDEIDKQIKELKGKVEDD